jgi:hypothetical protein
MLLSSYLLLQQQVSGLGPRAQGLGDDDYTALTLGD